MLEAVEARLLLGIADLQLSPTTPHALQVTFRLRFSATSTSTSRLASWCGGNIVSGGGFHGHYASINLSDHGEIIHINIEKVDSIQEQLVSKIRALAATPERVEGEVVPLRIVIPAAASIELWASAMPVSARAGDTLQTLAGTYHVPVWAGGSFGFVPGTPLPSTAGWLIPSRKPKASLSDGNA